MEDKELDQAIADRPYEKVTKSGIEEKIDHVNYMVIPDTTVTLCNITMKTGFSIRGESACVDPRNFNMEIGQEIAYREAFAKLWQLEGYLLAEKRSSEKE